jgi:hypothetical protein
MLAGPTHGKRKCLASTCLGCDPIFCLALWRGIKIFASPAKKLATPLTAGTPETLNPNPFQNERRWQRRWYLHPQLIGSWRWWFRIRSSPC